MGQKVDPRGYRVGVINDWNSKWYADSKHFADYLVEDHKIREYVKKKLYASGISKIHTISRESGGGAEPDKKSRAKPALRNPLKKSPAAAV